MFWMSTSCFLGTITLLVVTWFPAGERTTATGFIVAVQMVGLVPPAILFPQIVEDPGQTATLILFWVIDIKNGCIPIIRENKGLLQN